MNLESLDLGKNIKNFLKTFNLGIRYILSYFCHNR